jgi:signal transduction histidine kinase
VARAGELPARAAPARPLGVVLAAGLFVVSAVLRWPLVLGPPRVESGLSYAVSIVGLAPAVVLGWLVKRRAPASPVGTALAWVGAAPAVVFAVEDWGQSAVSDHPWPGAVALFVVQGGAWVWVLAGFAALCLVFPDGLLPGRRWRITAALGLAAAVYLNVAVSLDPDSHRQHGRVITAGTLHLPAPVRFAELTVAYGGFLAVLVATVVSLVVRYRRGTELVQLQLRWLMLGAGTVPVLLAAGWAAELGGASVNVAYTGFLVAMLVIVPAAIVVAVLRHDLLDIDRLLGSSLAWLLTSLVSAAIFAVVVLAIGDLAGSRTGVTAAAFVAALALLPLHRLLHTAVGRIVDRERTVLAAQLDSFVRQVRDGQAEPEGVEAVLRAVLHDPRLELLLRLPGADSLVDLAGEPAHPDPSRTTIPLHTNDIDVGVLVLGAPSARRNRRAREALVRARLPIEVSRLRLQLRAALRDAQDSRARLLVAGADERRRLSRDLHDGAQQQIVAVGMRLRSAQRLLQPGQPAYADLDLAVQALENTIGELRRLAHGVRPSRLDEGLGAAVVALVADSPVPVDVDVTDAPIAEPVATTAYYVIAEALTNALKHASATRIGIRIEPNTAGLCIEVSDDGVGGATNGYGLTSVRDRVDGLGGRVRLHSPPGAGTTLSVEL